MAVLLKFKKKDDIITMGDGVKISKLFSARIKPVLKHNENHVTYGIAIEKNVHEKNYIIDRETQFNPMIFHFSICRQYIIFFCLGNNNVPIFVIVFWRCYAYKIVALSNY